MYKGWDLNEIEGKIRNIESISEYSEDLSSLLLCFYKSALDFLDGKDREIKRKDDYLLHFSKIETEKIKRSNILNHELFHEVLRQKTIDITPIENVIDHDFDENEVIDIVKNFLFHTNRYLGELFDSYLLQNRILLKKTNINDGIFLEDNLNDYFIFGVGGINKVSMMFVLTHEFGHSLLSINEVKGDFSRETIPNLLELYLFDYLRKKHSNLDSLPFMHEKYIKQRNLYIDSLNILSNFKNEEDTINKYKFLNEKYDTPTGFFSSFSYFTSQLEAINLYNSFGFKSSIIKKIIEREKNRINPIDILDGEDSYSMFSEKNFKTIKKLVKK